MQLRPQDTTILLHMGIHKTGSTSLQKTFAAHRKRLRKAGIAFLGHAGPYKSLYSAFLSDPMRFVWNRRSGLSADEIRDRDRAAMAELEQRLRRNQGRTIVLSNEYLAILSPAEMSTLRDFLAPYGHLRAVYYYRELHSWLSSDSQQMAKAGLAVRPTPFGTGLNRIHALPLRVAAVFGREQTTFIRFEDAIEAGICNTFLSTFGLPSLTELGGEEIIANTSISGPAVQALFDYNRAHPLDSDSRDGTEVERLKALPGEKYRVGGFAPAEIRAYAAARREVRQRLGLRLAPAADLPAAAPTAGGRVRRLAGRVKRRLLGPAG